MLKLIIADCAKEPLSPDLEQLLFTCSEDGILVQVFTGLSEVEKTSAFLHSLACSHRLPEEALLLTDTAAGDAAAHALGIACVGIINGSQNRRFPYTAFFIEGFEEVDLAYLKKLFAHLRQEPALICRSNRLELWELSLSDVPTLFTMYQNKHNTAFLEEGMASLEEEIEKQRACIENWYPYFDYGMWGVYLKASHTLIGRAGITCTEHFKQPEYELGYFIDEAYQRQGYATECVHALLDYVKLLAIESVCARIHEKNVASLQVLKHCGYSYTELSRTDAAIRQFRIWLK